MNIAYKKENENIDFIRRIENLSGKQILLNNQYRYIEGIEIIKNLEDIVHISELPDSDAGVVPDTFAMRFSRV